MSYYSSAELCFSLNLEGAESVNLVDDCGLPDMQHLSKLWEGKFMAGVFWNYYPTT